MLSASCSSCVSTLGWFVVAGLFVLAGFLEEAVARRRSTAGEPVLLFIWGAGLVWGPGLVWGAVLVWGAGLVSGAVLVWGAGEAVECFSSSSLEGTFM